MNKLTIIIGLLSGTLTILNILYKYLGPNVSEENKKAIEYLYEPIIELSISEILIVLLVAYLVLRLLPNRRKIYERKYRAKRFYKDWVKLKKLIKRYSVSHDESLENEYEKLRKSLSKNIGFFSKTILSMMNDSHHHSGETVLHNLNLHFSFNSLNELMSKKCLDINNMNAFDFVFNILIENINKECYVE